MTPQATQPAAFNLRALVRETLATTPASDPREIASAVFVQIPTNQRAAALVDCLVSVVREVIGSQRPHNQPEPSPGAKPGSWKVKGIREEWARYLDTRWHVGEAQWKRLADCTRDDLLFAAHERRVNAERNIAAATELEGLADLLAEHKVHHVAELPEDVISKAMGQAA